MNASTFDPAIKFQLIPWSVLEITIRLSPAQARSLPDGRPTRM
jgi:hypothetical protein